MKSGKVERGRGPLSSLMEPMIMAILGIVIGGQLLRCICQFSNLVLSSDEWYFCFSHLRIQSPVCFIAVIGLIVGSFLNVVIHRLPIMMQHRKLTTSSQSESGKPEPHTGRYNLMLPRSALPHLRASDQCD